MTSTADRYVPAAGRAALTPLYDAATAALMRRGAWLPRLLERALAEPRPATILDLGCGTGASALALKRAAPDVTVIGVDGDPDVLRRAHAKPGGDELQLHEAMADDLPLSGSSVECVLSTLLFHHLSPQGKRAALAEVHRVLAPGGRLLICDFGRPQDPVMRAAFYAIQLLDGFATTRENASGRLPELVSAAGFAQTAVVSRFRTGAGTLELIEAYA